ncbi:MAG: hypothetical protein V2B20_27595 [Pseudomonadota bacterium]
MIIDKAEYHAPGVENEGKYKNEKDITAFAATHIICFLVWAGSKKIIKTEALNSWLSPILERGADPSILLNNGANTIDSNDFQDKTLPLLKKYNAYLEEYGTEMANRKSGFYVPYSKKIQSIADQILNGLENRILTKKWWEFWK